jgi:formylglycine-generating enzyme required for sulfatase activity
MTMAAWLAAMLWIFGVGAGDGLVSIPFVPEMLNANEGCSWHVLEAGPFSANQAFIAAPRAGEDRAEWIAAVRDYRDRMRNGTGTPTIVVDFDGVRAWTRLAPQPAKALALRPGDKIAISIEAHAVVGNSTLCVALDYMDAQRDAWTGWSGVLAELPVPRDGEWHRVQAEVVLPDTLPRDGWARPIFGMDATHDPAKGRMELRAMSIALDDTERMAAFTEACRISKPAGLDRGIYAREDLEWVAHIFTCHFTFLYDRGFYDPEKGYQVDAFLEDARQFGGYDAVVLWQAYPRVGVDQRNQFDFYRDLPGGLEGLRKVVGELHACGVKAFIDYNPWDQGTRRPDGSDEAALAEIVAAIDADGIFLDTMVAATPTLRATIDRARPGVVFAPEGHPAIDQLGVCNASWAQGLQDTDPSGMLHLKWLEPRHMQHQIRRWDASHQAEIETAFFNGSGMLVWENIFGAYNPWRMEDRACWRRASGILRAFSSHFSSEEWDPFYPALLDGLYVHRWPGDQVTVFTLRNMGKPLENEALFEVQTEPSAAFDVWNGQPLRIERSGTGYRVFGAVDRLGCIAVGAIEDTLREEFSDAPASKTVKDTRNLTKSVLRPKPVSRTAPATREHPPEGMVHIPGGPVRMRLKHMRRECGCYPDPGTPPDHWKDFLWGSPFDGEIAHDYTTEVRAFFVDEAEVSNADFKRFLDAAGYHPKHPENFLKHWPGGAMPADIADLPVVHVDLDDARAYAVWAGKRLPTEPEWHLAAQGTDGRAWPWGKDFDATRCNTAGDRALPVRSLPEGRSPFGCYHMSGNVWEWTESERDDGHTRFAMIRGGSYFKAEGSIWYMPGGPQPCTSHAKFLLMWPGLNRCATVGFRCVRDAY